MKKFFAFLGALSLFRSKGNPLRDGFTPYVDAACNQIYNLLFCDKLAVFRKQASTQTADVWKTLLAAEPYATGLKAIAEDQSQASNLRLLAYHRLREMQQPSNRQELLGVVVELGMQQGLDVLAAYLDGSVHYINHKEKLTCIDSAPSVWSSKIRRLFNASRDAVERIGPWMQPRIAPPTVGMIRMSFLVSDGLYFGQGLMSVMEKDELAAPIIAASVDLLKAVTQDAARE